MKIRQLLESATAGGTSTASVATVTKGSKGIIKRQKPTDNALDKGKLFQEADMAEGKDDKIAQLKKDHDTAVHWSKNEKSPQKREAARQKAEKIKRHLETQYKQGVAEVSQQTLQSYRKKAAKQKSDALDVADRPDTDDATWVKNINIASKRKDGIAAANKRLGVGEGFPKDPNAPKLVRDRKTGKQYDPNKEFEKKMTSPEVMAQMKRMAKKEGVAEGWDDEDEVDKITLIKSLQWPELVNKVNSAMKAMGWKGQRKDDGSFMFSTRGQLDDEWYIVVIDNRGNKMFTYALGTVEEGDPHIGEQESLPMTEASVSELMIAVREGFGLGESSVSEVSKATIDRYVSKASDAHGDADFKARMSKNDPDKRSYHVDQKKTAEKRRQGISRALDRMSREESVEEGDNDWSGSQGNFAGDKPFNLGSDVAKRLDVNDVVSYFGEKATILAMSKDRTISRIDLKSGITQNVKTSDLKRVGHGMGEATSVAVRMQRAADKQRAKSDASLARTPSSIPKKDQEKKNG